MALKNKGVLLYGLLCFMLFNLSDAWAQSPENGEAAEGQKVIEPLRVGDYLPESFWKNEYIIYNQGDTARHTLMKYKGKSLVLDFWATWCGYCIQGFPTLISIQEQYKDDINILLVNAKDTRDTFDKIKEMRNPILRENPLPSIIEDTRLQMLFPHGPIPHYVWINPRGRVAGITFREFVTLKHIDSFIKANKKYESND